MSVRKTLLKKVHPTWLSITELCGEGTYRGVGIFTQKTICGFQNYEEKSSGLKTDSDSTNLAEFFFK